MLKIALIGTGGTIASYVEDSLDILDYPDIGQRFEAPQLLAQVPELSRIADVVPLSFEAVSSSLIGPAQWLQIARLVMIHADDFDGFVISHGTGSLEETAYFLHLVLKTAKPVVLVGAQRPLSALSSDATMNLLAAVRVACAPEAAHHGVLVVLNDEVHSARDVVKTSTYRLQAFESPDVGLLAHVDPDRVCFFRQLNTPHTLSSDFDIAQLDGPLPRVDILYSYAGSDGAAVDAFLAADCAGIVSAGFAPGLNTPAERERLLSAREQGVVIVQSSRAGSGRVARRHYLRENQLIAAGNLSPQKARILLMLALTKTHDISTIQRYFDTY
ncbi:MAG: asparaginase [Alcaligenaceae bacterium]|nr:asparaginase [Alcaligenaceae bacterium]